ncbi:uncharacterized protein CTRU02_204279 [Colletotrichum truncatum]|uniref:Uncharacterized protein n=1 Tax=Colletotrichum truncatum TaxID=5467 RepID=A0ACC3ZBP2_COLTU|nr:uncharacterized protein CTRU02_10131 [Colletotrichum truncatum]KAF6787836.1 hypothetical protein CTRU02_10131 [Colletotrichum truncatum]
MPPNQRQFQFRAALVFNPNIGTLIPNAPVEFRHGVVLPYQDVRPPVQVFRQMPDAQVYSPRGRTPKA